MSNNIENFIGKSGEFIDKYSPEILTTFGVIGFIATTVMTAKATVKAVDLLEKKENELYYEEGKYDISLSTKEKIKTVWKCYIPPVAMGTISVACVISSNRIALQRNAIMATAYKLSETAFKNYKEKVIETIGEKKEEEIKTSVSQEIVNKKPIEKNKVHITNNGDVMCYDPISGRYFTSNKEFIKSCVNKVNENLLTDGFVPLNDLYYELGLEDIRIGDNLGWDIDNGLLSMRFDSVLSSDGIPCLVIDYEVSPKYQYGDYIG